MKFAVLTFAVLLGASVSAFGQSVSDSPQTPPETDTSPVLALPAPEANDTLRNTAVTYAAYQLDVDTAGSRQLLSGADLDATMDELTRYYEGDRLVNAQIAYAALVAAQHPEFIDSVRAVADYYGPSIARSALTEDPVYVTGFMGADLASLSVTHALEEDAEDIRAVGDRYRTAAYALQQERWARQRARDREARLSALESASQRLSVDFQPLGTDRATPTPIGASNTLFALNAPLDIPTPDLTVEVGQIQLQPDERRVGRMLAVAALQSIESGDMSVLDTLLDEPAVERCLNWVRLDLAQCVAAGHFKYEDSFCIAQHALLDVADCLSATRDSAQSVSN